VLFALIKGYARLAIKIYCRSIRINNPDWLKAEGPILLACNHPNSFLDGIILTTLFEQNIYTLARGDAFRKHWHGKVLRWIHLLPVYRASEGVENLEHNYSTFEACKEVFRQKGIIIIFSEGRCINEWHIRPLKKGTARLATSAWADGIDLTVLPVGFTYNRFRNFGKNVIINFGKPLERSKIMFQKSDGRTFLTFNEELKAGLQELVYEIQVTDEEAIRKATSIPIHPLKKMVLLIPAVAGFLLHAPLYFPAKAITQRHFDNDHFDSCIVSLLLLAYPFYVMLLAIIAGIVANWFFALAAVLLLPFLAWSCVQFKSQN
jgi:1-acyl-sn-glycerol-3-phosphate acyltransferase